MKYIKLILGCSLIFFVIIILYIFISKNLYTRINNLSQESEESSFEKIEQNGEVFFLIYKTPKYSFGSGHKYLYIFSRKKLLLGMCKYGEFPLAITKITKKEIYLEIKNNQNSDYVEIWKNKNKKIWKYKIVYSF